MTKPGQVDAIDDSLFEDGAAADDTAIPIDDASQEDTAPDDANLFGAVNIGIEPDVTDRMPIKPGLIQRCEDKVFGFLRRKKKAAVKKEIPQQPVQEEQIAEPEPPVASEEPSLDDYKHVDKERDDYRELLFRSREMQIGNWEPPKKENRFIRIGIFAGALLIFSVGCFSIYSELPTHPTIVLGMIAISLSGAVLVNAK
jgi:hypothetical protein